MQARSWRYRRMPAVGPTPYHPDDGADKGMTSPMTQRTEHESRINRAMPAIRSVRTVLLDAALSELLCRNYLP